ncbi:MAG: intradiol ring-cleavage dioxygenase [Emticicia sp.]|uniref:dioxygenase family protein n=1 Tax=Emticicia sp. TaxID=1930953 RepID=UPI003BA4DB2A
MKREDFIKRGLGSLGLFAVIPALSSCSKDEVVADTTTTTTTGTTISSDPTATPSSCSVTNSETEGPFPTKSPASYAINNIVSDRQGTPLTIKIYIRNVNASCAVIKGAIVDIWHCDAAGNYSQYGGTQMQSTNYTSVNFLRGRQTTDTNGMAAWTSIYPGWYSSRAPHIHVHVYNSSGTSLLVTQIAFPEDVSKVVYAQGVYASKGQADTTNARDNVFGDGVANEMSTVTGSVSAGYVLTHTIYVKG